MPRAAPHIDVRTIPPRERHPLIFSTFDSLVTGEALELVNDHDPRPLFSQFVARVPGEFSWSYLEQGRSHLACRHHTRTGRRARLGWSVLRVVRRGLNLTASARS